MTAQALPKTQELFEKLDLFASTNRKLNEFDIRFLKRDAEKLKDKIDYPQYYDFLGKISCLENNKKNIINYYENAIKLSPNSYNIQRNYVISLAKRGFLSESFICSKNLATHFPNEIEALALVFDKSIRLCRFKEALQLSKIIKKNVECPYYELIEIAADIFEHEQLNDDEAQHLCQLAFSVLESQNLYFSDWDVEIIEDCVHYSIYVDLPVEEIFDINWELAGIFVDNVENRRNDTLIFEYKSVDILEERLANERVI